MDLENFRSYEKWTRPITPEILIYQKILLVSKLFRFIFASASDLFGCRAEILPYRGHTRTPLPFSYLKWTWNKLARINGLFMNMSFRTVIRIWKWLVGKLVRSILSKILNRFLSDNSKTIRKIRILMASDLSKISRLIFC